MSSALKRKFITNLQIEDFLARKTSLDSLKKRFELLEASVKTAEKEIIELIEAGAEVPPEYQIRIRNLERKYPHWKSYYASLQAQVPSAPTVEDLLKDTVPTVLKRLLIK